MVNAKDSQPLRKSDAAVGWDGRPNSFVKAPCACRETKTKVFVQDKAKWCPWCHFGSSTKGTLKMKLFSSPTHPEVMGAKPHS